MRGNERNLVKGIFNIFHFSWHRVSAVCFENGLVPSEFNGDDDEPRDDDASCGFYV